MAIKYRENYPMQNDITDFTNEMIDELETLKAIAGKSKEKEKESEVDSPKKVESDSQEISSRKEKEKNPSESNDKKPKAKRKRMDSILNKDDSDGVFYLQVALPKEYKKKLRLIQLVSDVNLSTLFNTQVAQLIDELCDENSELMKKEFSKIINVSNGKQ